MRRQEVDEIRVVTVTKDGLQVASSSLGDRLARLRPGGFVAIDTEFSGLPDDPEMRSDDVQTRYKVLRRIAQNRAVFSVGISIFNPVGDDDNKTYEVATYDFLLSCQSKYVMQPSAGSFLEAHGFDFNRMFREGIPYTRASEQEMLQARSRAEANGQATTNGSKPSEVEDEEDDVGEKVEAAKMQVDGQENSNNVNVKTHVIPEPQQQPFIYGNLPRGLLWRIGRHGCPVIVHNGLMDLVFMYAAFQGILPPTLNGFVGSLLECVPAGYWDSKVLAPTSELSDDMQKRQHRASFLSYLFAKAVLDGNVSVYNSQGLPSPSLPQELITGRQMDSNILCALYAFRGFCPRGTGCPFLHDAFRVVREEREGNAANDAKEAHKRHKAQSKQWKRQIDATKAGVAKLSKKQRKRKFDETAAVAAAGDGDKNMNDGNGSESTNSSSPKKVLAVDEDNKKVHTAGWDAFCTGYIFASFRATTSRENLDKHHNYIALPNKLSDLLIRKSEYADLDG